MNELRRASSGRGWQYPPGGYTSISGLIESVQQDGFKEVIEGHKTETLLVSLLNALITKGDSGSIWS
jgi:hypothetical protein